MYDALTDGSALQGLKVLDLGQMIAGPFCAAIMADMGADVIKVESPSGDLSRNSLPKVNGESTYYANFNRSKRGITLNLKSEQGKEALRKLITTADVLIENFRPGVMERLGFSYEECTKLNPSLIYASVSGFGQKGDYASLACFDPIAQAMSGLMSVTGPIGGPNIRCGASIGDIMAGQNALIAILAALHYRSLTGEGQYIDIALTNACIVALSSLNAVYNTTGRVPGPHGNSFDATAPGNTYRTKDGVISISAGQVREWPKFVKVLHHEEWLDDPRFSVVEKRVENRDLLDHLIEETTLQYTTSDLIDQLRAVGLPCAPINSIEDVANDPHFRDERKMFVDIDHPVIGKVRITNQGIKMTKTNPYVRSSSPVLSQDTDAVLSELGYSAEEIQDMRTNGAV